MANFSATWANATNPTNFASARALNKMELNSSYYLLCKQNPLATTESNLKIGSFATGATAYTAPTGSRVGNVTYTYTGIYPRLLIVCVKLSSVATTTAAGGLPTCSMQIKDDVDGALFQIQSGSIGASPALTGGTQSETVQLYAIVNPNISGGGVQYRVNISVPTNSTATIESWTEWDLSAVHVPTTYTHGQAVTSIDTLNRYANAVSTQNAISGTLVSDFTMPAAGTGTNVNTDALKFMSIQVADAASTINADNPGGSITTVASVIGFVQGALTGIRTAVFPLAPFGIYRYSGASGVSVNASNRTSLVPNPTTIAFTVNESGTTTGNKFRDLDARNLAGANVTKKMIRTSRGTSLSAVLSSTSWSFYCNTVTIPAQTNTAVVQFQLPGGTYSRIRLAGMSALAQNLAVQNNLAGIATPSASGVNYSGTAGTTTLNSSWSWHFATDT